MYLFWLMFSCSLDKYPEVGLLGHIWYFLVFWGISILFSTVAVPVYIPTNSTKQKQTRSYKNRVVVTRGDGAGAECGGEMGKGGQLYGDGWKLTWWWEHGSVYRSRSIMLCIWNLYNVINQCYFKKKKKAFTHSSKGVWTCFDSSGPNVSFLACVLSDGLGLRHCCFSSSLPSTIPPPLSSLLPCPLPPLPSLSFHLSVLFV